MFKKELGFNELKAEYAAMKIKDIILSNDNTLAVKEFEIFNTLKNYYASLGTPTLVKRYVGAVPRIKDFNEMLSEIYLDNRCIFNEHKKLITDLINDYNYRNSVKRKMYNEIQDIFGSVKTAQFAIRAENEDGVIVFSDTFNNDYKIDKSKIKDPCTIDNKNGVVYLNVESQNDVTVNATIEDIETNGEIGATRHIRKQRTSIAKDRYIDAIPAKLSSDDTNNIIDKNPTTWFEFEKLSATETERKKKTDNIDCEYIVLDDGDSEDDDFTLIGSFKIKLPSVTDINAIKITNFFYSAQYKSVKLLSIELSNDDINYNNILDKPVVLNSYINSIAQTFSNINSYTDAIKDNMKGKGFFVLPPTPAKYIKFTFEQSKKFKYEFGHEKYIRYPIKSDGTIDDKNGIVVRKRTVDKNIQNPDTQFGRYVIPEDKICIEKTLEVVDGFKYCIGITDIEIFKNVYSNTSEIISTKYSVDELNKKIKRVSLTVDEYIPSALTKDKKNRNNFIKYYISFDGITWIRVSPSHHIPYDKEDIPPKIIVINEASAFDMNTYNYKTNNKITDIYFKAVLSTNNKLYTPILKEYRIKVETE